jgi:hypothetical protein
MCNSKISLSSLNYKHKRKVLNCRLNKAPWNKLCKVSHTSPLWKYGSICKRLIYVLWLPFFHVCGKKMENFSNNWMIFKAYFLVVLNNSWSSKFHKNPWKIPVQSQTNFMELALINLPDYLEKHLIA